MNGPFDTAQTTTRPLLPTEVEALAPPPLLLPGESLEKYQLMRRAILTEIAPCSAIQWLLAIDVVELSWEIQRYRLLRQMEHYRQKAIEQSLRSIDLAEIPPDFQNAGCCYTRQNAQIWRIDPQAASEIEARLARHGFDQHSINMEVYLQAREIFLVFEALLNTAQNRRISLLREIKDQRWPRRKGHYLADQKAGNGGKKGLGIQP